MSIILSTLIAALTPTPESVNCARLGLAQRTGQESCWAKFYTPDNHALCVDHSTWVKWLLLPSPGRICIEGSLQSARKLRWKAYSPPLNEPRNSSDQNSTVPKKTTLLRLNITHLVENTDRGPLISSIQRIEAIREKTSANLAKFEDDFGILRSLLLNEKTSQSPISLLRKIGFVHLASATGIHLYALARGWDSILKVVFFSARFPAHIGVWWSRRISFALCFCVWLLSGARLGMLRPWIVLSLREISVFLGFRWRRAAPLFLALILDLAIAGFWAWSGRETFTASGRIIYALAVGGGLIWCRSFKSIHTGLAVGSWLLVALWEAWHAGSMALFTPILSLISLPLVCFFVFPLMILGILAGEFGFVHFNEMIARELSWGLSLTTEFLARFAFTTGNFWVVSQSALLWGAFLSTLLFIYQGIRQPLGHTSNPNTLDTFGHSLNPFCRLSKCKTGLSVVGVLFILRSVPEISPRTSQIEQLDVGQGDSALIQSESQLTGLIDAGSQHAITDEGWIQLFTKRQITRINWAAISHLDEDHSGGFLRLARLIHIDCIATPLAQLESSRGEKYEMELSRYSLKIVDWDSRCLPFPTYTAPASAASNPRHTKTYLNLKPRKLTANANMGAIFVPLDPGGFYLSAGDANQRDEQFIGKWATQLMQQTTKSPNRILKISHHGSKTSSAPEFLKRINPTEVWISAGRGNRYGHPTPIVLKRLQDLNMPIRRTDEEGVLTLQWLKK